LDLKLVRTIGSLLTSAVMGLVVVTAGEAQAGSAVAEVVPEGPEVIAALDRPARLLTIDASLPQAFHQLYQSSGVPVSFSPSRLPTDLRVSCYCDGVTVREALAVLLARTRFAYREVAGHILIFEPSNGRQAPQWRPSLSTGVLVSEGTPPSAAPPVLPRAPLAGSVVDVITGAGIAGARVTIVGTNPSTVTD
jgi:hypothetical protein